MTDNGQEQTETPHEAEFASRVQPVYIYWYACSQCGYETAAHGRVACPDCGCGMTAAALAGAVVDKRRPINDD